MEKLYQAPNLTYVEFTEDAITTSYVADPNVKYLGEGDWGVKDAFI